MKRMPFRVVFVGVVGSHHARLLSQLSPAIQPICCRDWDELAHAVELIAPELVVSFPGTPTIPPFPLTVPLLTLDPGDLKNTPESFEAKILGNPGTVREPGPQFRLLGNSLAMARVRGLLVTMAKNPLPLLLTGENGTGKDLAASVAHQLSSRAEQPFIVVNCGAIPAGLAESEFFGCVRGAFTGAETRAGFCQQALAGTLFLDEIGELAPEIQSKLLRVVENNEVRRVGSSRVEATDFRLICATNRDLNAEVAAGRFREDLYYRIDVLSVHLPSLRERKEDIPILANHFLASEALGLPCPVKVGARALAKMTDYHWPGNLRQLRNVLVKAAVIHGVRQLDSQHIQCEP